MVPAGTRGGKSLSEVLRDLETRVVVAIKERLAQELRPMVDEMVTRIVNEETAKMSVELATMMSFERIGSSLHIVIKKMEVPNGK